MMIHYAKVTEENGVIIALDQEKAYDRVAHDYLWRTLDAFHFPPSFTATVQSLYEHATTVVIINGETSSPFRITQGVRQGDPMSCLLFNLAIELLACMLRNSQLEGFYIPGVPERIITTLFADDTMTYLSERDDFAVLSDILNTWCLASTARFNVDKTEIIPIGSTEYREQVITKHCLGPQSLAFPAQVHITCDGDAIRSLSAWIGNNVDNASPWSTIMDKIKASLLRWSQGHPTLKGRRLIIQMVIGGMTQYLTRVQGMPKHIEESLTKIIRNFMWDDHRGPTVSLDMLCQPLTNGGLGVLHLAARNDVIIIKDLQSFLDIGPDRPTWAFIVDFLILENITRASGNVPVNAQTNIFLQTWKVNIQPSSHLPIFLKKLLKTGTKYKVTFGTLKPSKNLQSKLPIWYHFGAGERFRSLNNSPSGKCLRDNHNVATIGDLLKTTK
ncbi:hypothetical protein SCP_0507520 [Sparassis crispa]|uniref:Reverse transcriptase domain-containing protein n=1 Tax=Sparassis crispa TaxID=139825 RepID=A0A401GNA6_9APHY|nr:hypothetical protein SCP_0507520 [Sparassis crispa]GBE83696.1 hypothetical protein SCP_0507520 [Sparassis crispa]